MYELLKTEYRPHKKEAPVNTLRSQGWVPGVIYGKKMEPVSFQVNKTAFKKFLHHSGKVFEVEVAGKGKHLVSLDNIQFDHLGDKILHVAFHKVEASEKIKVKLPVHVTGTAVGSKAGGMVQLALHEIEVKGLPKDMPEFLEVDVTDLEVGHHIALKDITPPKGLEWIHDVEDNVVSCHQPKAVVEPVETEETLEAAPEAEAPAAEAPVEEKEAA